MCQLNFRCPECGGKTFIFTIYDKDNGIKHGAVCGYCKAFVTVAFFMNKSPRPELRKS